MLESRTAGNAVHPVHYTLHCFSCTQIFIFPFFFDMHPTLCFLCLSPLTFAPSLSFKSPKTCDREERRRNAAFRNKNKYAVCPRWYPCFQTGWESRKQLEVCSAPVPRFYKPGGCTVLLSSGGQYSARCTWRGKGGGDCR